MATVTCCVKKKSFDFWQTCLNGAKLIVAPMVDQSELAWRLLSRQYGAELCYTPMIHAALFHKNPTYRRDNFETCSEDRPLIVQFCANDPNILLQAARHIEGQCDAVDINLGCPQTIAKKGHYGAFLQDDWGLISEMVKLLDRELSVPVTCKIRIFDDIQRTVEYARMLESSGCQLLTVHGRTREQKGVKTGLANWDHIRAVKESVSIPVIANGNIQYLEDVHKCIEETMVDGVMSAESQLFNPALFTGQQPECWKMAEEYLKWVRLYPPSLSVVRGHLFKLWHHVLQVPLYTHFRDQLASCKTLDAMETMSHQLKTVLLSNLSKEELECEYSKERLPFWRCQPYIRPNPDLKRARVDEKSKHVVCKKKIKKASQSLRVKKQWITCAICGTHPKGLKCVNNLCKNCCKVKSALNISDCPSHHFLFKTKYEKMLTSQPHPGRLVLEHVTES